MKHDAVVRISLLLIASIVTLAALYYSQAIMVPVTFALFTVASVAASKRASKANPGTAGARRHDRCDSRRPCDPGFFGGLGIRTRFPVGH